MEREIKAPVLGGLYQHFKGGLYVIQNLGVDSETKESVVIYNSVDEPFWIWVRPLWMWNETVAMPDGTAVKRFRSVSDPGEKARLLWESLKDAPFYEDKDGRFRLEKAWHIFDKDTDQGEILGWFDERFPGVL